MWVGQHHTLTLAREQIIKRVIETTLANQFNVYGMVRTWADPHTARLVVEFTRDWPGVNRGTRRGLRMRVDAALIVDPDSLERIVGLFIAEIAGGVAFDLIDPEEGWTSYTAEELYI